MTVTFLKQGVVLGTAQIERNDKYNRMNAFGTLGPTKLKVLNEDTGEYEEIIGSPTSIGYDEYIVKEGDVLIEQITLFV